MAVNIKKLIEDKMENGELNAKELVYTLLMYVSDENIEEAISNNNINISEEELMDYKKEYSSEEMIFFKDFETFRIEVRKNANGYFYRVMNYDENNIPDEEIKNSTDTYEYFSNTDEAWESGKEFIERVFHQ